MRKQGAVNIGGRGFVDGSLTKGRIDDRCSEKAGIDSLDSFIATSAVLTEARILLRFYQMLPAIPTRSLLIYCSIHEFLPDPSSLLSRNKRKLFA